MRSIDYIDIALHTAPTVIVVGLGGVFLGFPFAWATLGLFWLGRELWQHNGFGGYQSQLEWIVPLIAGFATAALI